MKAQTALANAVLERVDQFFARHPDEPRERWSEFLITLLTFEQITAEAGSQPASGTNAANQNKEKVA